MAKQFETTEFVPNDTTRLLAERPKDLATLAEQPGSASGPDEDAELALAISDVFGEIMLAVEEGRANDSAKWCDNIWRVYDAATTRLRAERDEAVLERIEARKITKGLRKELANLRRKA